MAKPRSIKRSTFDELVDFLYEVAVGKRKATDKEIREVTKELNRYLSDLEPRATRH
jgi:hypothetical protein